MKTHDGEDGFKYLHFASKVTLDMRKWTASKRSLKERGREKKKGTETGSVIETETMYGTEIETGTETGIETDAQGEMKVPRTINQKEVIHAKTV